MKDEPIASSLGVVEMDPPVRSPQSAPIGGPPNGPNSPKCLIGVF